MSDAVVRRMPCASTSASAASRIAVSVSGHAIEPCDNHTECVILSPCLRRRRRLRTRSHAPLRPAPRPRSDWDAWGDRSPPGCPRAPRRSSRRCCPARRIPSPAARARASTPSRLADADLAALAGVVGRDRATRDDARPDAAPRREEHARPAAPPPRRPADRARRRRLPRRPTTRCSPCSRLCDERGIAVVPFGGGTSRRRRRRPRARRAPRRHRARPRPHRRPPRPRRDVAPRDLRRRHAPVRRPRSCSARAATPSGTSRRASSTPRIGGYAATRSSGQASRGYGRFDDLVHALRVATPAGELSARPRARERRRTRPARALPRVGGRVRRAHRGHRARSAPIPAATAYGAWTFPDFASGAAALREATQRGIRPTVAAAERRDRDARERRAWAAISPGCADASPSRPSRARPPPRPRRRATTLDAVFAAHGAKSRGEDPARSWERGRFASPALRDTLLDAGVLAETLETATTWAQLPALKRAVTDALTASLTADGTKPIVLCHISHVYPAGASLYFTVVAALTDDPQRAVGDGRRMPRPARSETAGGTITHHHAVGRDHRPYLEAEIGALGVEVLRAVKATLDPRGIMNPGALVAPGGRAGATAHEGRPPRQPRRPRRARTPARRRARPSGCATHGITTTIMSGGSAGRVRRDCCAPRSRLGTDAVVVAGGDGTVNLAIQEVAGTGIPLGIVPSGTGNDFAATLGLRELDVAAAADTIAAGRTRAHRPRARHARRRLDARTSARCSRAASTRRSTTAPTRCDGRAAARATTSRSSSSS